MKYKAIIFDMDGTIIDTETIWQRATKELIEARGVIMHDEHAQELDRKIRGLALVKSCQILKDMFKLEDHVHHLIAEKSHRAVTLYSEEVKFIQGFTDFHQTVLAHNIKNGIATNADDATVEITNKKLNLKKYFGEHIYAISAVDNICKPDPAIYLHAAEKLGVAPEECIAIEDSEHGVNAAKNAGMFCIGINSSDNKKFIEHAHHLIDGYHEIELPHLLQSDNEQ